jgi:hypothetical protein
MYPSRRWVIGRRSLPGNLQPKRRCRLPPEPGPVKYEPLEGPIQNLLPLPEDDQDLHIVALELRVALRDARPDMNQCVKAEERTIPRVTVSKSLVDRATKAFHVILTAVDVRGIPFRKARSKYDAGHFEKGSDRLSLTIEEVVTPREPTVQEVRKHGHWQKFVTPSGKLTFTISPDRYGNRSETKWTESDKVPLEELLSKIVRGICKHYADVATKRAEAEERNRKQHEAWLVERDLERKRQHEANLEATAHARAEDLLKAAEWFRIHQSTIEFINACEQRWRTAQAGDLTRQQEAWLLWARETARALSPFETGYPDAITDGAFDKAAVPFAGPYPPKRDFPRPPTMPKIPPPTQQSGYGYQPEPKEQYPFWLKYQGR